MDFFQISPPDATWDGESNAAIPDRRTCEHALYMYFAHVKVHVYLNFAYLKLMLAFFSLN